MEKVAKPVNYEKDPAVTNLRNYLRIRSVHPNINYDECIAFLRGQAASLGLPVQVHEPVPRKPVLVMTWEGLEPALPSILLNSHMDVVPVNEESWTHPPFEARLVDGVIYARGVQDMKSVAIQYIEAVRKLKNEGTRLRRTVHLSFVPDEEIGGYQGMREFVKTEAFKQLNVGCALDEGYVSAGGEYLVFNAERSPWLVTVHCPGTSGHGSLLLPNNNGEKIRHIIDKFMDLRHEAKQQLAADPALTVGDVTSVNLTKLKGGVQINVIPETLSVTFDIRLATTVDHTQFEDMIKQWCREAGEGVWYEFAVKSPPAPPTPLDDSNPYWLAFRDAARELGLPLQTRTLPGATDSRYLRAAGTRALGFSPIANTPPLLHAPDERLPAAAFLRGIACYARLVPALANVARF